MWEARPRADQTSIRHRSRRGRRSHKVRCCGRPALGSIGLRSGIDRGGGAAPTKSCSHRALCSKRLAAVCLRPANDERPPTTHDPRIGHNSAVVFRALQRTTPMSTSYLTGRLRSFGHAFRGLGLLLRTQHNARIHAAATVLVIAAGAMFGISPAEWGLIALAVVGVWATEALNTAIEFLVDLASSDLHPLAAKAKDVAAGAVLVAAIGSLVVGAVVFVPHVLNALQR